jgi:hypothetical protein
LSTRGPADPVSPRLSLWTSSPSNSQETV